MHFAALLLQLACPAIFKKRECSTLAPAAACELVALKAQRHMGAPASLLHLLRGLTAWPVQQAIRHTGQVVGVQVALCDTVQ
jgi:hypothetical protein